MSTRDWRALFYFADRLPSGDKYGYQRGSWFFEVFAPRLIGFLLARSRELWLAEDLTQEVMLTVYRKASYVRDRKLFRVWLFSRLCAA